jgi:hypothetical protein
VAASDRQEGCDGMATGMTVEGKRAALKSYCNQRLGCDGCKCVYDEREYCWSGSDEHMLENYERVFGNEKQSDNPYWERICKLSEKQRAKGMKTYGQGIESNPADILTRIQYLQEELIDGLMYCEWIKEKLMELENVNHD